MHLEPLAMAANITQAANVCLDTVALTFTLLYHYFLTLPLETAQDRVAEEPIRKAVCATIDKCWLTSDQDVFIAAIILNPTYITKPFTSSIRFTVGGIHSLMERLYRRFFRTPAPPQLLMETQNYIQFRGVYSHMKAIQEAELCRTFELQVSFVNSFPDKLIFIFPG